MKEAGHEVCYIRNIDSAGSIRRAQSVATIMGYGPDQPGADNSTTSSRQASRRVEIAIFANDKLKGVAQKKVPESEVGVNPSSNKAKQGMESPTPANWTVAADRCLPRLRISDQQLE